MLQEGSDNARDVSKYGYFVFVARVSKCGVSRWLYMYVDGERGCVSSMLLCVVCVFILTRLWPNGYYVYPFQVLIDSPLPRVESDGKNEG